MADADIVIASDEASFLDPHVSIGQVTAYEAIALVRKSPMEPIVRVALTGRHERITAEQAYQLGIVSQVVPAGEARAGRPGTGRGGGLQLAHGHGRQQAGPVGGAGAGPHRRLPGRRRRPRLHVGPPRPGRGPPPSPSGAASWQPLSPDVQGGPGDTVLPEPSRPEERIVSDVPKTAPAGSYSDYTTLVVERKSRSAG